MKRTYHQPKCEAREGTATVEFALVAPLFLLLLLGMAEMSRALDVSTNLSAAIREGGRLASMNNNDKVPAGSTINQKVISDIKNMLTAVGINGQFVTVNILHADGASAGQPFDLSDPNNKLAHFLIEASVPYNEVSVFPLNFMDGQIIRTGVVFRLGQSKMIQ